MKVVPFLIFWALPFLTTEGHDRSLSPRYTVAAHAEADVTSIAIQDVRDVYFPGDPSGGSLGSSLWDEEDSLEDDVLHGLLSLSWSSPNSGSNDLGPCDRCRRELPPNPSQPRPLRC
jgi:hypothetical protein